MSQAALGYETYRSDGRAEWMMRIGPTEAAPILFVPPLFEEMNRLRALIAAAMRGLAERGYGCWLPDLKGSGESPSDLAATEWDDWRHDVKSAFGHVTSRAGREPMVAAFRGGCLLDDASEAGKSWRMAPVTGQSLARDMSRAGLAGVEWAGYAPPVALREALSAAIPSDRPRLRVARLASDAGPADVRLQGPALWRRSEPGVSIELAEAISDDLDLWMQSCADC